MNQYSVTQLDSLLNFSNLHLLIFTSQWKLSGLYPNHRSFLGWDEEDIGKFDFEGAFLGANQIDLQKFLGHFQQKNYVIKKYYWRNAAGDVSGPYETYFRIKKENGLIRGLMAFVKLVDRPDMIEFPPEARQKIFLSDLLPELVHDVLNPLGVIVRQVELLQKKFPDSGEYTKLLKFTYQVRSILQNLNYKLTNERMDQRTEININQVIKEEIKFLNADPFFKNQVEKNLKFNTSIPKCQINYLSISGVINEFYRFFRKLVKEDHFYVLQIETLFDNNNIELYVNFLGDFQIPNDVNFRFPVLIQGFANQIAQNKIDGIDVVFLAFCLNKIDGHLEIVGRKELLTLRFTFPSHLK